MSVYKCKHLITYSFGQRLLNTYYTPENVLFAEDTINDHCSQENQSYYFSVMVILVEFKKNERFLQNSPSNEYALLFLPLNVQLLLIIEYHISI